MTNKKLEKISQEIDCISRHLSLLDPDNAVEHKLREQLFRRWDFLDDQLDCASASIRRQKWRVISCNSRQLV